jgi:hypothetical protein
VMGASQQVHDIAVSHPHHLLCYCDLISSFTDTQFVDTQSEASSDDTTSGSEEDDEASAELDSSASELQHKLRTMAHSQRRHIQEEESGPE